MCIFLLHRVVTFGDVPNIALRAVIPGVCLYAFLPVFGSRALWKWGQKATDLRRHRFAGARARDTMVNAEEEEKGKERKRRKEKGPREKKGKKERNNKRQQRRVRSKHKNMNQLCAKCKKKKRKHQFWIDEETFHTKTVIKEPASRELCAVGTRFNKT